MWYLVWDERPWPTFPGTPQDWILGALQSVLLDLSQDSSEFLLVKTNPARSSAVSFLASPWAWLEALLSSPGLVSHFSLFSALSPASKHLFKACSLFSYFWGCSSLWVSLLGYVHHSSLIFPSGLCDFLPSIAQLLISSHSSQTHALQLVCCVPGAELPTTDALSAICFVPFGLYGYFSYLFLVTSAVWVCTFPHITQMKSPCLLSMLSGSFCSFCPELGQGAVPLMVLSVDIIILELCVVITEPDSNVPAVGGCRCTGLNEFLENCPATAC